MIKTRIDKLLDTWKDTKDPDPEWSGAAYDYFKSQKEDLEKDLEVLKIIKEKRVDVDSLIYIIKKEKMLKEDSGIKIVPALDSYNFRKTTLTNNVLTEEEFNKLVDWLKKEN